MANFEVDFQQICCFTCGCIFYAPRTLIFTRQTTGETTFCPSGHENTFNEPEVEKARKRELLEAVHRAEQFEAKASELEERLKAKPIARKLKGATNV